MKRIIYYLLLIGVLFLIKNVNANTINDYILKKSDVVPDVYVTKKNNEHKIYDYMYIIKRKSNGQFVYCIEPGIHIDENAQYVGRDDNLENLTGLSTNKIARIKAIAYYGYGYVNKDLGIDHSDKKWYAVSQYLIWEIENNNHEIYFTDYLQGPKVNKFENEINELKSLVESYNLKPKFNNMNTELKIGNSYTIEDANKVLSNYKINLSNNNIMVNKINNCLLISALKSGSTTITLTKHFYDYNNYPFVFKASNSQMLFQVGNLNDIVIKINVNVTGGKIKINKIDKDLNSFYSQGDGRLDGAIFDVLNSNRNLISTLTINKNGFAETENVLDPGKKYYIKEKTPSKGYLLNSKEYEVTIDSNTLMGEINIPNEVIKNDIEITKVLNSGNDGIMHPEEGIVFDIYNKTGLYYTSIKTDKNGFAKITLPYGLWTFKQKNTSVYYDKVHNFDVNVQSVKEETTKIVLSDNMITYKLKLINVDIDNKELIKKDGVKFKIKNLDNNEYVCQNVSYPNYKNICEYETENGMMITPMNLDVGHYEIEQVENQLIDGYLWNKEKLQFNINQESAIYDENLGNLVEVTFPNKRVVGKLNINKYGEIFNYNNNIFSYDTVPLDKALFSLYANEDIYDETGNLIYLKDELVANFEVKDGKYSIDNLYLGKYRLVETNQKDNYVIEEPINIEFKYKDQYTGTITIDKEIINKLIKGNIVIKKIDSDTKKPLKEALFNVYNDNNELVFTGKTDTNGELIIRNLVYGDYYFKEIESPEGYLKDDSIFNFKISKNGIVVNKIVENFPEINTNLVVNVPNTLSNTYYYHYVLLLIFAGYYLLYVEKVF